METRSGMSLSADLSGKRALITGASTGFGAHFAQVLAAAGATVILGARRAALLETVAAGIAAIGGEVEILSLDVANRGSVEKAVAAAGRVDILINNAGVGNGKPLLEQTEEDWDWILNTNLKGAWLVATSVAKGMRTLGCEGSIINVASILGLRQAGRVAPYAISKSGLIQLTKQFALELARFNIRCNAIAPGYFATALNRDFFLTDAGKALIARMPQRRLGQLEDLNGPLLLLASDASRYMTGSVLVVDGGHLVSTL
jgi:NAD(P)-dependent dehydrogenase (short-subunit alcohol dehydrogenase family)